MLLLTEPETANRYRMLALALRSLAWSIVLVCQSRKGRFCYGGSIVGWQDWLLIEGVR